MSGSFECQLHLDVKFIWMSGSFEYQVHLDLSFIWMSASFECDLHLDVSFVFAFQGSGLGSKVPGLGSECTLIKVRVHWLGLEYVWAEWFSRASWYAYMYMLTVPRTVLLFLALNSGRKTFLLLPVLESLCWYATCRSHRRVEVCGWEHGRMHTCWGCVLEPCVYGWYPIQTWWVSCSWPVLSLFSSGLHWTPAIT